VRIARYTTGDDPAYGLVEGEPGDEVLHPLRGDPLYVGVVPAGGEPVAAADARLLAPVIPRSKIIGVVGNYARAGDNATQGADEPTMFLVPNTAVVGPGDPVVLPRRSAQVNYGGQLAVVIATITKSVPRAEALSCVWGYTCANDVTEPAWQRLDGQWARAKGFDTSCPLGPWLVTEFDGSDRRVVTRLDGEVVQEGRTADLVYGVAELVAHASAAFTLLPGDVILTGTPAGVGPVRAGQRVSVTIDGIGTLDNPFVRR